MKKSNLIFGVLIVLAIYLYIKYIGFGRRIDLEDEHNGIGSVQPEDIDRILRTVPGRGPYEDGQFPNPFN